MTWAKGGSRRPLPADWSSSIVPRILGRDPICRICERRRSTEVDHRDPTGPDTDDNLQGVCTPCHATKSSHEGLTAQGIGPARKRPLESHPGSLSDGQDPTASTSSARRTRS